MNLKKYAFLAVSAIAFLSMSQSGMREQPAISLVPGEYMLTSTTTISGMKTANHLKQPVHEMEKLCFDSNSVTTLTMIAGRDDCSINNVRRQAGDTVYDVVCGGTQYHPDVVGTVKTGSADPVISWDFGVKTVTDGLVMAVNKSGKGARLGDCPVYNNVLPY